MAGLHDEAITSLREALFLGENQGYLQSYISEGNQIKELLLDKTFEGNNSSQKILTCFEAVPSESVYNTLCQFQWCHL